jgi:hypothetical protein
MLARGGMGLGNALDALADSCADWAFVRTICTWDITLEFADGDTIVGGSGEITL